LINRWVVLAAGLIGIGLFLFTLLTLLLSRPPRQELPQATAMINRIAVPTATAPLPTATLTAAPTDPVNQPSGAGLAVGVSVRITGTGGDGLRIRSQPGLSGEVLMIAPEEEVFQVTEGPVEADGYRWWRLVSQSDPARSGWGVSDYLDKVTQP
jgi:hypothetical protein